jgi:hypothetical protein
MTTPLHGPRCYNCYFLFLFRPFLWRTRTHVVHLPGLKERNTGKGREKKKEGAPHRTAYKGRENRAAQRSGVHMGGDMEGMKEGDGRETPRSAQQKCAAPTRSLRAQYTHSRASQSFPSLSLSQSCSILSRTIRVVADLCAHTFVVCPVSCRHGRLHLI